MVAIVLQEPGEEAMRVIPGTVADPVRVADDTADLASRQVASPGDLICPLLQAIRWDLEPEEDRLEVLSLHARHRNRG